MRIYNAKNAQIEMPLSNGTKLVIPGHSISGEFMPNSTVISVFMSSYKPSDIAFVISGPFEISMLSNFAGSGAYVVSSLEEAVARFAPKVDPTTTTTPAPVIEEEEVVMPVVIEEVSEEKKPIEVTEESIPEPVKEVIEAPVVDEPIIKKATPRKKADKE